jgi:hypothetical protein
MTGTNLNNIDYNNISNRRVIKRTTFKKFNNISPDFRNIQLNIKNSLKKSLMEQNNNLNNYSSSVSIFFQTQLPEIKKNAFKNFVYISKNKKTKNNPKNEMLERIKNKIINNFYITLCKCIKKSIYKYYLHHFVFYLKYNRNCILKNEKITNFLKNIIIKREKNIKKYYLRKYRENVLIEKIKLKLFNLTDYEKSNNSNRELKVLNINNNKTQKLFDIYSKYGDLNIIKKYFSVWKKNIFDDIQECYYTSSRDNNSKKNMKGYIKKMINYTINDSKSNEQRQIIYIKYNNCLRKNERSHTNNKKSGLKNQSYSNNCLIQKYNKKIIINKNMKINNMNHYINDNYNLYYFNQLLEKINTKNIINKWFYLWIEKINMIRNINNKKGKKFICKNKFLKYFLLTLAFINKKEKIIDNKIIIGTTMFIWYKNTFNINKLK